MVNGGSVHGLKVEKSKNSDWISYDSDIPVRMTNDHDRFENLGIGIQGGDVYGQVTCTAAKANISLYPYYFKMFVTAKYAYLQNASSNQIIDNHPYDIETNGSVYFICDENGGNLEKNISINLTGSNSIVVKGEGKFYYGESSDISITAKNKKPGDVVVKAENHTFTQEELEKFSLVDMDDCELVLKNNQIVIQKKVTAVTDGQTLQQCLDEIAAKGTSSLSNPETVEIPAEGITIDTYLQVRNKCHAKLTGGPVRISPSIGAHYPINIWNSCSLVFENITIDFMNNGFKTHSGIFDISGNLTINKGVQFINVPQSGGNYGECLFSLNGGTFTYWDGTIKAKGVSIVGLSYNNSAKGTVNLYGGVLETTVPAVMASSCDVTVYGCKVKGGNDYAIRANYFRICENAVVETTSSIYTTIVAATANYAPSFTLKGKDIIVQKSAEITGGVKMPTISLLKDAVITATSKLHYKWTISSSWWKEFTLGKAFITGQLSAADFNQMTFEGMPSDREAYYDEKECSVKLRKKTVVEEKVDDSDDLQNFIDGLGDNKGTEDDPVNIPVGDDGLTIDNDVNIVDDLQLLIDGTGKDDLQMLVDGGFINLKIGRAYFGFKNVTLVSSAGGTRASGKSGGGINNGGKVVFSNSTLADGTYSINNLAGGMLILKENTVTGSSDGLIVNSGNVYLDGTVSVGNLENKTGGRIYIMDALTEDINISFTSENDVDFNTPIIMGDEYYTYYALTESDLSHINISLPEGYAWKYSEDMGGVIIYAISGISGLDSDRPSVVGVYDTTGRKVTKTSRGVHVQRMSNGEVRKVVTK